MALTGLEVWTEQDQIRITPDANHTLWAFLRWRRGLWGRRPHDSTQLLTWVPPIPTGVPRWAASPPTPHHQVMPRSTLRGRAFQGDTVGLAPVEGMCLVESSGGVTAVSSAGPDPGHEERSGAVPQPAVTVPRPRRTTRSSPSALQLPWPMR